MPPGYGPQQPWGYPPPPTPQFRPPNRRGWVLPVVLVGGVLVIMLALFVGCAVVVGTGAKHASDVLASYTPGATQGGGSVLGSLEHPEDVEVLNCAASQGLGWAGADVRVTNHSSKPSTYYIKVAYASPDGSVSYGDGFASIDTLAPGQTTTHSVFPGQDVPAGAQLACTLTSARRTVA